MANDILQRRNAWYDLQKSLLTGHFSDDAIASDTGSPDALEQANKLFLQQQQKYQFDGQGEPNLPRENATGGARFEGHWEKTPQGYKFVRDRVWNE